MPTHPFDLQSRAELAVRALTALRDPAREGLIYFLADWTARPPRADRCLWDGGDGSGRHMDALTLAHSMVPAGSAAAAPGPAEGEIESWMMRLLGDDGLSWLMDEPFAAPWGPSMLCSGEPGGDPMAEVSWAQRGTLLGLTSLWLATGEGRYLDAGRRLVDGLGRIAQQHAAGLHFPEGYYRRGGWGTAAARLAAGVEEYNAAVLWPLARFYQVSGYAPALHLAEGIARFALRRTGGYLPSGRFAPVKAELEDHFHTRSNFMLGILKLGLVDGRPEYVAWARQGYEQARRFGTDFGWFPEGLHHRHGEVCCMTDMLELALLLGRHVDASYYADAERFGRNHLLEGQFLDLESLRRAVGSLPRGSGEPPHGGLYSTTEGVVDSQYGAFASRSALNDAFHVDALAMMQCCNAAGTRGLYDLWRHAVDRRPGVGGQPPTHQVNLRFSVATPELTVVSHEPATGRLDLFAPTPSRVRVRLPEGESRAFLGAAGAEAPAGQGLRLEGREGYVEFELGGPVMQLRYRLRERSADYAVGAGDRRAACTGTWRGETLMRVDPPGTYLPLYRRDLDLRPVQPAQAAGPPIDSL